VSEAGPAPNAGDLLARWFPFLGKKLFYVALVVGGDALQAADRDRLGLGEVFFLHAPAPPRRLARPVGRCAPRIPGNTFDFQLTM